MQLVGENAPLRIVDGQGAIVSAPISHFDEVLLACTTTAWQPMSDVVGRVLASVLEAELDQVSDAFLYQRLQTLAASGALELQGDPIMMRARLVLLSLRSDIS